MLHTLNDIYGDIKLTELDFHFDLTMCQYIDVSTLTSSLPETTEHGSNPSNHYNHPEIKLEIPICSLDEELIESGITKIVQSCTVLYNLPDSHYLRFKGFSTNIGMFTLGGVLKNDFCGYFHAMVHNSSLQTLKFPPGTYLGSLIVKKYYNTIQRKIMMKFVNNVKISVKYFSENNLTHFSTAADE